MTPRRGETHEQYLARLRRMREYMRNRLADPEFRERYNAQKRERYRNDPEYREQKRRWTREAQRRRRNRLRSEDK